MRYYNHLEEVLVDAVANTLWTNPHEDLQVTIQPVRITPVLGAVNNVYTDVGFYTLPSRETRYVLYLFGQQQAASYGIDSTIYDWVRCDHLIRVNEMRILIHVDGRVIPPSMAYIKRDASQQMLLAVERQAFNSQFTAGSILYINTYSSDWLSFDGAIIDDPIVTWGGKITTLQDAANTLTTYYTTDGTPRTDMLLYHNGYYINDTSVHETQVGDTLVVYQDKTLRGYFDIWWDDLSHFHSELDHINKVIIQVPDDMSTHVLQHEPMDEMDIYICAELPSVNGHERIAGVFYSRLMSQHARMLTHRDFCLDATRIEALVNEHPLLQNNPNEIFIRVFCRHHTNGLYQFKDVLHLSDLFLLPMADRLSLMTDAVGGFDYWKAPVLEQSVVNTIRSADISGIYLDTIKGVYSLDYLNLKANSVLYSMGTVILPESMQLGGILLGYNNDGRMVWIHRVPPTSQYVDIPVPDDVEMVQCLPGSFVESGALFDRASTQIDQASYFDEVYYYLTPNTSTWHTAVQDVDYVIDRDSGRLTWDNIHQTSGKMKRILSDSIYRQVVREAEEMHLPIDIYGGQYPPTLIPLARTDVFINGHYAVEGLDYQITYPKITIYNKQYYLEDDSDVTIDIFHYGVPVANPLYQRYGFITNGTIPKGDPITFMKDRYVSLYIDGLWHNPHYVKSIDNPVTSDAGIREGGLYCIRAHPQVLGPWARMRLASDIPDAALAASMAVGRYLPDVEYTSPVYIARGHSVYSVFVYNLINRLRRGEINVAALGLSRAAVSIMVRPFLAELERDIVSLPIEHAYLDVHPTPSIVEVDVSESELLFLRAINSMYLDNRLVFNTYINIQEDIPPHT